MKMITTSHSQAKNQRGSEGPSCVPLINITRGAAHIIPHQLQQSLRLRSCPASDYDCIPENRQGSGKTVMFSLAEIVPFMKSVRPELASKRPVLTHIPRSGVDANPQSVTSGITHTDTHTKPSKQRCRCFSSISCSPTEQPPLSSRRLVRLCGAHAGLGCRALLARC